MTAPATSNPGRVAGSPDALRTARVAPVTTAERIRRFAVMAFIVGLWMAIGLALNLGAVAYLLTGIPLTIAFQVFIARRPVRSLWLLDARPFHLDRKGIAIAIGLAAFPLVVAVLGVAGGHILDVGYGLAGVAGAAPAAVALRAMDANVRRALVRSILTAGAIGAALFVADRVLSHGLSIGDPVGAIRAFGTSLLLYIPLVFVIEEVFFRGALDTYARGSLLTDDRLSAVYVSLLWGFWHLPLLTGLSQIPVTMGFHLVVGILITLPWRQSGNLAVPGVTHAVIDAIRDGLAAI